MKHLRRKKPLTMAVTIYSAIYATTNLMIITEIQITMKEII